MYLEDATVGAGQTLLQMVEAYGHKGTEGARIWGLPENATLAARGGAATLAAGDVIQIPIPWGMKSLSS